MVSKAAIKKNKVISFVYNVVLIQNKGYFISGSGWSFKCVYKRANKRITT